MPLTVDDLCRELRSFAETSLRRELEEIRRQIKADLAYELSRAAPTSQPLAQVHHVPADLNARSQNLNLSKLDTAVADTAKLPDSATLARELEAMGVKDEGPHEWMTRHMRGFAAAAEVQEAEAEMVEHAGTMHPRVSRRSLARKGRASAVMFTPAIETKKPALFSSSRTQFFERKRSTSVSSRASKISNEGNLVTRSDPLPKDPAPGEIMKKSQPDPTIRSSSKDAAKDGDSCNEVVKISETFEADAWKQAPAPDAVCPVMPCTLEDFNDDDQVTDESTVSYKPRYSTASQATVETATVSHHQLKTSGTVTFDFDDDDDDGHKKVSVFSDEAAAAHYYGISSRENALPRIRWADFGGTSRMRDCALAAVRHEIFDAITGILIIANSMTIGFQVDYMVRNVVMNPPLEFRIIEYFFCCAFAFELGLRLFAYQLQFLSIPGWRWNLFDVVVVSIQMLETLMTIITTSGDSTIKFDFSIMRILRVLRLVRIVRLVRVLRVISELRTMVYSIYGTLKPFCWTVMLLMLLVYMVGVQFTQTVADYKVTRQELGEHPDMVELDKHFGSLNRALFSLYQSLSGGIDWGEVCWPLIHNINPFLGIIFSIYIAFATFALLNVVTGVFVQSAMRAAKEDNDVYLVNHVRELFENTDTDGSGKISWEEFEDQLGTKAMKEYFKHIDIDITEAHGLFFLLDMDGSGTIDADEFLNGSLRLRGPAKAIEIALIMRTLKWIAEHSKGTRKLQERMLVEMLRRSGRATTMHQAQAQVEMLSPKSKPLSLNGGRDRLGKQASFLSSKSGE